MQNLISDYMVTHITLRNNNFCFNVQICLYKNGTTFEATRHVPWALNIPDANGVFRALGTCLVASNVVLSR